MGAVTSADMLRRLKSLVPNGWFGDAAPLRDVVLGGLSDVLAWIRTQGQVVRAGTRRIGTTGWLLDIDAYGFFGDSFVRRAGELDDAWRTRYAREIFRPRVTRAGISLALTDLTGKAPAFIELWNTADCGAYNTGRLAYAGDTGPLPASSGYGAGPGGYNTGRLAYYLRRVPRQTGTGAGCYGTYSRKYQFIVLPHRGTPKIANATGLGAYNSGRFAYGGGTAGTPTFRGWGGAGAYYNAGTFTYQQVGRSYPKATGVGAYAANVTGSITDDEIEAVVAATKAAGVKAIVNILAS